MNRIAMIVYIGVCALVGTLAFVARPESSSGGDDGDAALALLGGGKVPSGRSQPADRRNGTSSFMNDANFSESGTGTGEIDEEEADTVQSGSDEEPDILEPVNPNNPVNPQTGEKFTDAQMKMFGQLRQKFPGNSLIPTRKTPEAKAREAEERKAMFAMQSSIAQGNATAEEVNAYYDFQMKTYKDRQELLSHVFESRADKMSDDIKEQYKKVQKINEQQLKILEEQKQRALQRNGG